MLIDKKIPPSAFQIRFAGYKGVLTTDPRIPDNLIQLRTSMRKFQSDHRRLEVLQTSRPQAVYLNHQLIMLLSNLGVPDDVFLRHQEKMLDALACTYPGLQCDAFYYPHVLTKKLFSFRLT